MTVPSWTSCCRTPASSTCTSKTSVRRTCATASRTRWTPLFLDRASSQKASHSGWQVEGAAELKSSRCGTTVVAPPGLRRPSTVGIYRQIRPSGGGTPTDDEWQDDWRVYHDHRVAPLESRPLLPRGERCVREPDGRLVC